MDKVLLYGIFKSFERHRDDFLINHSVISAINTLSDELGGAYHLQHQVFVLYDLIPGIILNNRNYHFDSDFYYNNYRDVCKGLISNWIYGYESLDKVISQINNLNNLYKVKKQP